MELEYFRLIRLLIADPHLTRTAERLGMTQSALSKKVQAIERELDFPLFERRGPRGLLPLPHTLELAKLGDRIGSAWTVGLKRIKQESIEPQHFVLVGPHLFLREVVLPWWNSQREQFPHLQLEIQTSSLSKTSIEVLETHADAGILEHREELSDYVCRPIYTERWGIARHPGTKYADLNRYRWAATSPNNNQVDQWLVKRQRMSPPNYELYWEDFTALGMWVAETPGAATVLPWHAALWLAKKNRVVFEPLGPDSTSRLYLAYARENPHRRLLKAFMKVAEDSAFE